MQDIGAEPVGQHEADHGGREDRGVERGDVDVVHNQSLHFLPLALSGALSVPVVTTLHTPPLPWMEMGIALAGPLAAYVCVSRANSAGWTTLPTRPRIIHNGVEDDGGGPGEGGEHLVWTGRLTPEKGTGTTATINLP